MEGPGKWSAPGPVLALGGPAYTAPCTRPAVCIDTQKVSTLTSVTSMHRIHSVAIFHAVSITRYGSHYIQFKIRTLTNNKNSYYNFKVIVNQHFAKQISTTSRLAGDFPIRANRSRPVAQTKRNVSSPSSGTIHE